MNVYKIVDNAGWVLDTVIAWNQAEAAKAAAKENCEWHILDCGPAGDRAWRTWMNGLNVQIGDGL